MNYWLHRITGGDYALPLASKMFENGFLSIGWSDLSNNENLGAIQSGIDSFNQMFQKEWGELPRNRFNLWRFVNDMKPGDYVVVPRPYEFAVCRIKDDVVFSNESIDESLLVDWNGSPVTRDANYILRNTYGNQVDLGFYRRIEIIEPKISRSYANQDLYSRMKIRQTNACIYDIRASVEEAIERARDNRPINLRTSIIETTREIVLGQIRKLCNQDSFEELIGKYLYSVGATDVKTPNKAESPTEAGDADRIGYFDKIGIAIMVQAKKHNQTTDHWAIEQIRAYKQNHPSDDTTVLWVISTCDDYNDEAKKLAQEERVRLINGLEFVEMLLDAGIINLA